MRVCVSDTRSVSHLRRHLIEQGFPTSQISENELNVLFPACPSIFAAAVELDLWSAAHAGVTVTLEPASDNQCRG